MAAIVRRTRYLLNIMGLLLCSTAQGGITFSSKDARLAVAAAGAKLNVVNGLNVTGGTLQKVSNASLSGAAVTFSNGTFMQDNMPITLSGSSTFSSNIFALNGNDVFDGSATPTSVQGITVSGQNNMITGEPTFYGANAITLQDSTATVTLAIQSPLNKNLVLAGGRVYLGDNFSLGDSGAFSGEGALVFNGYRLSLGGKSNVWTSTLRLVRAQDVQLNSDVKLAGVMVFDGDATLNGNGNELDLTYGGTIRIKKNSTVNFSNVKIRGLHKYGQNGTGTGGNIVFDDTTASLHLDQSEMELNSNYTFTTGGIYVESASLAMVKNYLLTFDRYSTLTVDGTTLTYEPISYQDQNNVITSGSSVNLGGGRTSSLVQLNSGTVRVLRVIPTQYTFDGDTTLGVHIILTPNKTMSVSNNAIIDGANYFIYFGRANSPLLTVAPGKRVEFRNIVLWNFSPSHVSLGAGAEVVFGTGTTVELGQNEIMPTGSSSLTSLRFQGSTVLNGKGQYLDLGNTASITLAGHNSSLLLDNITLRNLGGTKLRTLSPVATVSLRDAKLKLQTTYTFTQGHLEVLGDTDISGEKIFSLETPQTSTIHSRAMLTIDHNTTFSYSPHGSARNDLLWMPDSTSILFFNGTTLKTTTTGMQFTRGTVLIDGKVNFYNDGASPNNLRQGIRLGDNIAAHDVNVKIMPAASINLQTGIIDYRNAS